MVTLAFTPEESYRLACEKFQQGEKFIVSEIYGEAWENNNDPHNSLGIRFDHYVDKHPGTIKRDGYRKIGSDRFAQYKKL